MLTETLATPELSQGKRVGGGRAQITVLAAITLLALGSPLVKWLIQSGGVGGLIAPESISFCNVLFVGNFCAGIATAFLCGPKRALADLRQSSAKQKWLLLVAVLFAVVIPVMIFTALKTTSVTNLILLGRLEAIAFALFAWIFLRQRLRGAQISSYTIIAGGVLTLVLVQGMWSLQQGDLLILGAALIQGLAGVVGKVLLRDFSPGAFVFLRNAVSAVVFFVIAIELYGFEHFAEAFRPGLWGAMVVYGLGVVAAGQLAWYSSLRSLSPSSLASWSMLSPALGILFAYLLLHEIPTGAQIIGGVVIVIGMWVGRLGQRPAAPLEGRLGSA